MAIIVEEEKLKSKNSVSWLGSVIILAIIGVAGYYLFLAAPAPAVITPPAGLGSVNAIAQVHFNATAVVNSPTFQGLKQYINEPTSTGPVGVGRPNPFVTP